MRQKLLLFTFAFAPRNDVGTFRNLKFSKYLARLGYELFIFTADHTNDFHDLELNREIPANAKVFRKKFFLTNTKILSALTVKPTFFSHLKHSIRYIFFSPDKWIWWGIFFLPKMIKIIRKEKINIVMVSGGPASSFVIGYLLKKMLKIKLVLDFRDPWTQLPVNLIQSRFRKRIAYYWEKRCVLNSDLLIVCTKSVKEDFLKRYNPQAQILQITSGFDLEDYTGYLNVPKKESNKKIFIYAGKCTIYRDEYNPIMLIKAFVKMVEIYNLSNCELHLIGLTDNDTKKMIDEIKNDYIFYYDIMPKSSMNDFFINADIFVHFNYPEKKKDTIGQKLCQYAIFNKPIITFNATEGDMYDFITNFELGECSVNDDLDKMVVLFYKAYNGEIKICDNPAEKLSGYNYEKTTQILSEHLLDLINEKD
jgi:glycosyltransferase involved in cell wall biosynthesis